MIQSRPRAELQRAPIARVKICGITNWPDAKAAIALGADALGFNFYKRSPRKISVSHAREIIRHMPKQVSAVGVFVNASAREVLRVARSVKLHAVQLHGDENTRTVSRLARELPVIKAFRVRPSFRLTELNKHRSAAAFLLDGFDPAARGGTGKRFNWRLARAAKRFGPVILAGGLKSQNVAQAIREVAPFAVDVCSGVELSPGEKSIKALRAFMAAAKPRSEQRR